MKDTKICQTCKKPMEYRKKWRNNWDDVKYCGEKCRRNKKNTNSIEGSRTVKKSN